MIVTSLCALMVLAYGHLLKVASRNNRNTLSRPVLKRNYQSSPYCAAPFRVYIEVEVPRETAPGLLARFWAMTEQKIFHENDGVDELIQVSKQYKNMLQIREDAANSFTALNLNKAPQVIINWLTNYRDAINRSDLPSLLKEFLKSDEIYTGVDVDKMVRLKSDFKLLKVFNEKLGMIEDPNELLPYLDVEFCQAMINSSGQSLLEHVFSCEHLKESVKVAKDQPELAIIKLHCQCKNDASVIEHVEIHNENIKLFVNSIKSQLNTI